MSTDSESPKPELFDATAYRVVRPLAKGAMGFVYLVEHRLTGCQWVAKVVHERIARDPQLLDRVRIEAQALRSLDHPNIVSVLDFGTTSDARPFIIMEYLDGRDLGRELAAGHVFDLPEILRLIDEALSGLAAAHALGIIHRDLKPENLFLKTNPDGSRTLKVLDFGVARVIPGTAPRTPSPLAYATGVGVIIGTLKYVSPEGAAGLAVDYRADVYSIGLVLYRLLAGRCPFDENLKDADLIAQRLSERPKPPSFFAPRAIAPELDEVVLKALQLSPADRYQSAKELKAALRGIREHAIEYANSTDPVPIALRHKRSTMEGSTMAAASRSRSAGHTDMRRSPLAEFRARISKLFD